MLPIQLGIALLLVAQGSTAPCQKTSGEACLRELFRAYCAHTGSGARLCQPVVLESATAARLWVELREHCGDTEVGLCARFKKDDVRGLAPAELVYDHRTASWMAGPQLEAHDFERDGIGVPTVRTTRERGFIVRVSDTNPLLYRAAAGTPKEEAAPVMADLLAGGNLLSGWIGALVASVGSGKDFIRMNTVARNGGPPPPPDIPPEIIQRWETFQRAVLAVQDLLEDAARDKAQVLSCIQQVEQADGVFMHLPTVCTVSADATTLAAVDQCFQDFYAAYESIARAPLDCDAKLLAYLNLLGMPAGNESSVQLVERAAADVATMLSCLTIPDTDASIRSSAQRIKDAARKALDSNSVSPVSGVLHEEALALQAHVKVLQALSKDEAAALTTARTQFAQREATIKLAAQIESSRQDLADASMWDSQGARLRRAFWIEHPSPSIRWDKVQTYDLSIKAASPWAAEVAQRRPVDATRAYKTASRAGSLLGVSAAIVYTPLAEPTFGAVPSTSTPTGFVIDETNEKSRAGEVALFLHVRLGEFFFPSLRGKRVRPGVEIGVGIDTDHPSLFTGIALELGRYIRLGGGWTGQRLTTLRGQQLGDAITGAEAIRTGSDMEDGWYLSFSLAVDSFKLFSRSQ